MRDTTKRFLDIHRAIARIMVSFDEGRQAFDEDEKTQVWVIYHLIVIGEAVRALPQEFKDNYPHIPWRQISGMRDMLTHQYFVTDNNILWAVLEHDIPKLKAVIDDNLKRENDKT